MSIHPTALIDPGARLGEKVSIGPYAVIEADTEIGDGSRIAAHVVIKRYTRLGRNNQVAEHAVLGGEPQDLKFNPCPSFVEIGDGNLIREGVTVHRSNHAGGVTRIGHQNFLMAYSHVAHDCQIGNQVILANGVLLGGHVEVADRAFLSGVVAVHQFCRVGHLSLVAGCARIVQDCLPFIITDGQPGRARGLNMVGMKRAGMAAADIAALKRAFHVLRTAGDLKTILARMDAEMSPAVQELAAFIRASRRGFAHCR